ncbi:amiloride-sensitive sodium channel subunit delta [Trichosurus vulpecula]|uniref:amiloride-sensitive sodium channel subunit delta n=1 Tax=Trichosurus vulpecula TaxID=9337 RepID=UPI00186B4C7D|nr:amiloride-sensitive sodium channel subunit delta [Trichosurus vulpecula]
MEIEELAEENVKEGRHPQLRQKGEEPIPKRNAPLPIPWHTPQQHGPQGNSLQPFEWELRGIEVPSKISEYPSRCKLHALPDPMNMTLPSWAPQVWTHSIASGGHPDGKIGAAQDPTWARLLGTVPWAGSPGLRPAGPVIKEKLPAAGTPGPRLPRGLAKVPAPPGPEHLAEDEEGRLRFGKMETPGEQQTGEGLIELYDSYQDLFNFFCTHTTIHGMVRLVCSSRNRLKTAFWSLLFLATFGILYWQFGLLFEQYWKYSVIMTVSVHSEPKMFPSITLCDMNPHRSLLVEPYLEDLDVFAQENIYSLYKLNITERQAGSQGTPAAGSNSDRSFHLDRSIYLEKLDGEANNTVGFRLCNSTGGDCFYRTHSSGVPAVQDWYQFHFINIMALLPPHSNVSHEAHDGNFIFSCCYNGKACQKHDYKIFQHPIYGSCYTFNNEGMNNFWQANRPGLTHGISLILKAEPNHHLPLLSTEAGVKVMIHAQNHTPFLEYQGFNIRPGTETTIGVREDEVHRLGGQYGRCTKEGEDVDVQLLYDSAYSTQACLHSCFQELMIQTCGCGYYFYPLPRGAQYCNYNRHPAWGHCFYKLYQNLDSHRLPCFSRCPKPCRESLYHLSAGVAKWPSSKAEDWILSTLGKTDSKKEKKGIAKVHIFYQQLNYRSMDETPVYSVTQLLSRMGNLWSLWFGSSVLSVVEMLELLLDAAALTFVLGYRRFLRSRTMSVEASEGPREGVRVLAIQQDQSQPPWKTETTSGSSISEGSPLQAHSLGIMGHGRFRGPWLQSGLKT